MKNNTHHHIDYITFWSRKPNMVIICRTFEFNCSLFYVLHKSVWEAKIFEEICTKQRKERSAFFMFWILNNVLLSKVALSYLTWPILSNIYSLEIVKIIQRCISSGAVSSHLYGQFWPMGRQWMLIFCLSLHSKQWEMVPTEWRPDRRLGRLARGPRIVKTDEIKMGHNQQQAGDREPAPHYQWVIAKERGDHFT